LARVIFINPFIDRLRYSNIPNVKQIIQRKAYEGVEEGGDGELWDGRVQNGVEDAALGEVVVALFNF
jgi:hypothetical protein